MESGWLILTYLPVSLFSLRTTYATSSGGKTLLVPTPYTFKVALIAAGFRVGKEGLAREIFDITKSLDVRFSPPEHLTVNHTFVKIKREPKEKSLEQPFTSSIAFREFCYYQGDMKIAVDVTDKTMDEIRKIILLSAHINYFGKQGSFFQFKGYEQTDNLAKEYMVQVPNEMDKLTSAYQVTQYLDDLGETDAKDLFDRVNTYSSKGITLHKHRVVRQYMLPLTLKRENNRYSYYSKTC